MRARRARSRIALLCVLAGSSSACVTTMYAGPRRSDGETMVVHPHHVAIQFIDYVPAPDTGLRLLPGTHSLQVTLADYTHAAAERAGLTVSVCFTGRPGHTYHVQPRYFGDGSTWRAQVIDETVADDVTSDCSRAGPRATARPPSLAPPVSQPAPDEGTALDRPSPTQPAPPSIEPPPAPAAPPAAAAPAVAASSDAESPRVAARTDASPDARDRGTPPFEPRIDIGGELGLLQGGDMLVMVTDNSGSTDRLSAGDCMLFAIGVRLTPLWLAHTVGFGIGGSAGIKYWSVGGTGGEASLSRHAFTATGHVAFAVAPRWLLILQSGIERDSAVSLSVNNGSTALQSRNGYVGEIAVQRAIDDYWSFAVSLRLTAFAYVYEDATIEANSVGVAALGPLTVAESVTVE